MYVEVWCFVVIVLGGLFCGCSWVELMEVILVEVFVYLMWDMGCMVMINLVMFVNKGLEVIEVYLFFDVVYDDIEVVVYL